MYKNYRGISLLSIVVNVFARVLVKLKKKTCCARLSGFLVLRAGRSTIDMIFSLKQLHEKCREQNIPLYLASVDLAKAFDIFNREGLYLTLSKIGCPPQVRSLVSSFDHNTSNYNLMVISLTCLIYTMVSSKVDSLPQASLVFSSICSLGMSLAMRMRVSF